MSTQVHVDLFDTTIQETYGSPRDVLRYEKVKATLPKELREL